MTTITPFLTDGSLLRRWRDALELATGAMLRRPANRRVAAAQTAENLAAVRALADSYRNSDPGFASDLYAAADRHEREHEAAVSSR